MLPYKGAFYLYMNDWGNCTDDNCQEPCVYVLNHIVRVYRTTDFQEWDYLGRGIAFNFPSKWNCVPATSHF